MPALDQTNTLVVLGGRLLVKAYRRLCAGPHPEVELLAALAGRGAPVPTLAGSVHWVPADGGPEVAIALAQAFVPGAEDGWEAPIERAAAGLPAGRLSTADRAGYRAMGAATGRLHAALLTAFGGAPGTSADGRRWAEEARVALDRAAAVDGEVRALAPAAGARLAAAADHAPAVLARIHGDLHVAQFLRRPGHPALIVDFEGDPLRTLAERRRPDSPLRDLAGLLRSIDHLGSAAARRLGGEVRADAWIAAARAATLAGYAATAPIAVDPAELAALELAKACTEFLYALLVLPDWAYAPRAGLRRLLERPGVATLRALPGD